MELTELSAGRFERLAAQLRNVQPLHVVFNDHSFYQKRPTLLLFWFLKQSVIQLLFWLNVMFMRRNNEVWLRNCIYVLWMAQVGIAIYFWGEVILHSLH